MGEYRLTISDFDQGLNLDSRDALTYLHRGNAYNALGQHLLAIDDYNAALHLVPEGARSLAGRGNAFLQLEEYDQAILDYERAITLDAGYAESAGLREGLALAYDGRGRAKLSAEQGRYDDAIQDFD